MMPRFPCFFNDDSEKISTFSMKKVIYVFLFLAYFTPPLLSQVAVIAHRDVPVDQIKKSELLDFFIGDIKKWKDGTAVVIFDMKEKKDVKITFYKYLGKTSSRMKSIWMKNMLAGEGAPPKAVKTPRQMLLEVASTPGAIGFIDAKYVDKSVKVLKTIPIKK
ncbi:MAG: hypothetical protein DWQ05_12725 [Calditrichaeota bacterium]|nr:MAG: hypothetical protein DWQ05_12725 [Calditrichota bacterium]